MFAAVYVLIVTSKGDWIIFMLIDLFTAAQSVQENTLEVQFHSKMIRSKFHSVSIGQQVRAACDDLKAVKRSVW